MNILACLVKFIVACGGLLGAAGALGLGVTAALDYKLRVPFYFGAGMAMLVVLCLLSALLWRLTALEKQAVQPPLRRRPARATPGLRLPNQGLPGPTQPKLRDYAT